ncbi:MAG: ABC transporter permease [Candidatus Nanopelagicales bacterium]
MNGTMAMLRLDLRRDRWLLPAWLLGLVLVVVSSAAATGDVYPDQASLATAAETLNSTGALVALYGRVYDPTSLGAIALIKLTAFGAAIVAILFVFIAVRHTRSDEESGRMELLAGGAVGRFAPLGAALIEGTAASLVLGAGCALGLGLVGLPWSGAVAFGAGWAATGIVFTAAGVAAAQLTVSARAAIGLGLAVVGVAYVLRAVGDLGAADPGWESWLSPIGWSQQLRPFAGDRWWVLVLPLLATAAVVPATFALRAHRDFGAGYLPDRPGSANGRMGSALALAWRLQRGVLFAWLVGGVLMGLVLGSIAHSVTGMLDSPQMRRYIEMLGGEQGLTDAFLAAEVGILGAIVAAYGVSAVLRMSAEEGAGRAEEVLATAVSRLRWAGGHLVVGIVGVVAILLATGAAMGVAHGLATGDPVGQAGRLTVAAAGQVPAALVVTGLTFLLFGLAPRWTGAGWALLLAFVVLGEFGSLWQLPRWVLDLSPFAHSPQLPGGDAAQGALVGLTLVAVALLVGGLMFWRRRDVRG